MKFGLDISQHQLTFEEILKRARLAEEAAFDGAWVFDHFKPLYADPEGPCLEAWTLLAALAAHTSMIRLGTLVTGITYRHPSVLTTEIVTVDHVSGGRVECGLGAAWNESEHQSLGIPFPTAKERMERLEDGIEIFRRLTSGERVSYQGRHHSLDNAQYHPLPVQRPHPPIWVGANRPQLGLPLVGRQADVWHGWGGGYAEKWDVIRRSAEKAGRDPAQILKSSSLSISEPWDEVRSEYETHLANGVSYLIVEWPTEGRKRLEQFIDKVLPDLRPT